MILIIIINCCYQPSTLNSAHKHKSSRSVVGTNDMDLAIIAMAQVHILFAHVIFFSVFFSINAMCWYFVPFRARCTHNKNLTIKLFWLRVMRNLSVDLP
jgi:hypothetical protein